MKKAILATLLVVLLSGCSLPLGAAPTITPTAPIQISSEIPFATSTQPVIQTSEATSAPATSQPVGKPYNQSGISFALPACLAFDAVISTLAAVPPDPNGAPSEFAPEQRVIKFTNYPLSGKYFEPVVHIYPVADYVAMQEKLQDTVTDLSNLLASHPAALPDSIPLLPLLNAQQVFHARESYLEFQNGSGIAFLTEYAQYAAPANNFDLFYTYQGITSDGKYWVSAFLPVNIAFLQDSPTSTSVPAEGIPMPDPNSSDFSAQLPQYYNAVKGLMVSADASAYTPDLTCLDAFLQSLDVEAP